MSFLSKIFGDANDRYLKSVSFVIEEINCLEPEFEKLTAEQIKTKTAELKKLVVGGQKLEVVLAESFALVREAAKRTVGQRHYDVQLIGGLVLHEGKIAEMRTGEGKTLVATLSVYLNALVGQGVHVVTVNDYLSRRDAVWMGQIYDYLGMTVGVLNHETSYIYDPTHEGGQNQKSKIKNQNDELKIKSEEKTDGLDEVRDLQGGFRVVHEFLRPVTRREAYEADITYGTNNEFGFDYLRDNMVLRPEDKVQSQGHHFAIVDEVDSILIDEARTPLIISAPDADSTKLYETFSKLVPRLQENDDYNIDEKMKAVSLTEKGIEKMESALGMGNIYEEGGMRYVHHLEQAVKAQILFKKDRDYVVKDGQVIIVDEFTGRLMPGRRWSDGLHQAMEAKEGVLVQKESRTMATVTFQNYFRLYRKLSGMTGTAVTSAEEFHKVYGLDVVVVPTNKPMIRTDCSDRIYKTEEGKFRAVAREIKEKHEQGQPVLVGTVSIEKNETLSMLLEREGVPHHVLNAKNHEREAEIIAQAGRTGAVTVATNMAGRGVDIMLGGVTPRKSEIQNPKFETTNEANFGSTDEYKKWEEEYKKVVELGGLHVIGTERHEARRIDNQLRGRSGRQGDPGSSQFFVSTEDDLARIFGGDRLKNLMDRLGVGDDDVIENRLVSKAIEQAQAKIEGFNFDARKYVLDYDDVMNRHRKAVYGLRDKILVKNDCHEIFDDYFHWLIEKLSAAHMANETGEWNIGEIEENIRAITNQEFRIKNHESRIKEELDEEIMAFVRQKYQEKEQENGAESMRRLEKLVLLRVIDELWVDHLETMEYLRESVRLRAYGQRDPLAEYKIEGQKLFEKLMEAVKIQSVNLIFKVSFMPHPRPAATVESRPEIIKNQELRSKNQEERNVNNESAIKKPSSMIHNSNPMIHKVGRNDPCPCGSGKKYKKCHGA